jgi:uncharacterized membrane protein YdbT with pleckstrin-like domain
MGKYINENLIGGEQVVYESKLHWIIFVNPFYVFVLFIPPILKMISSEFGITNKRVIIKTGFLSRKTVEMNINKVESVNVDQGLLGRLLGYGTIKIIGTGGSKETFDKIMNPLEFRKKFQEISMG